MTTSLQLGLVDGALNSLQKTIPFINPNASDYALKTFAEGLYNLSNDTLNDIVRIDKTDITNAVEQEG